MVKVKNTKQINQRLTHSHKLNQNEREYKHKLLLASITKREITDKIRKFRGLDLKKISDTDLSNEILNTISISNQAILLPYNYKIKAKTRFYRVRKIDNPCNSQLKLEDAWSPKEHYIKKPGRLNKVGESLLYTALTPETAIAEMKIKSNEKFYLIVYEAITDINAVLIGYWTDASYLNDDENFKMSLYSDFLKDEFSRDVGEGTEYLYRASEIIVKDYFDLPEEMQDAWCYTSVANKKEYQNVCLRPEKAKTLLELKEVNVLSLNDNNDKISHFWKFLPEDLDDNGNFRYPLFPPTIEQLRERDIVI